MGLLNAEEHPNIITTSMDAVIKWAQESSLWPFPMGISCCAIEMMAIGMARHDVARFGMEVMRMTPRQSDCMIVAGTVTYKMAWVVRKIYDQMPDPKWVLAMGVCTSTGGMYRTYSVVQGIDRFLPVDAYISGCPPRPEAVMKALMYIQDKIKDQRYHPALVNLGKNVNLDPPVKPYVPDKHIVNVNPRTDITFEP